MRVSAITLLYLTNYPATYAAMFYITGINYFYSLSPSIWQQKIDRTHNSFTLLLALLVLKTSSSPGKYVGYGQRKISTILVATHYACRDDGRGESGSTRYLFRKEELKDSGAISEGVWTENGKKYMTGLHLSSTTDDGEESSTSTTHTLIHTEGKH